MIRAIAVDAVGTLIHPEPSAAHVYAAVGARFGSRLALEEIQRRFRAAFARQEDIDAANALRTDEGRELMRWRHIVAEVLDDVDDPRRCFELLYEHFRRPESWRVNPDAPAVLGELRRRGYRLALASNFDARLRPIAASLPGLAAIAQLLISSEVGWRKPAPQFFAALGAQLEVPAADVLLVGDDRVNDFDGAIQAGLQAILFDPRGRALELGKQRIGKLEELLDLASPFTQPSPPARGQGEGDGAA